MTNDNLFCALRAAFPDDLDAIAVETTSASGAPLHYSWRDLDRMSARIANLLDSLNIPSGSRVAVQVEKSVEAMALYLATLRAGHVFLPLNTAYQSAEIEYFITNAEPAVVVCSPANFGWVSKIAFQCGTQSVFTLGDDRSGTLLERAVHCADSHTPAQKSASDMAAILYTSGTTGRSKGAMLSHGNLLSNAVMLKDYWGWKKGDVLIHALPIFHVHGLFVAIHAALLNGSKMIWFAKFEPKAVIAAMARATVFMGVPTLYVRLLAEPGLTKEATRHMRLFISGSAPLLIETFREWQTRTGHTILERYGMSAMAARMSAGAARWALRFRVWACGCRAMMARHWAPTRSAISRCKAPMCSAVTGACPRRPPRSSPLTAGSRPVMSARSMRVAM